ncbi:hypothetical protein ACP0HM_36505 [Escherichia coli]
MWNTVYPERATRGWSRPASRWTASCCNSCRRWAGEHINPNRRLRLAAEPQTGRREVSALTGCPENLSVRFFSEFCGLSISSAQGRT